MKSYLFKSVISPNTSRRKKQLTIKDGLIVNNHKRVIVDKTFMEYYALPGFVDIHIHGANGHDVMDASRESMEEISKYLVSKGVTSFLGTTVTAVDQSIENAIVTVKDAVNVPLKGARCEGLYLEGPFLSVKRKGAHPEALLQKPDIAKVESWLRLSDNTLKVIAVAPELEGAYGFIEHFSGKGVKVALAHSDADYATANEAINRGASIGVHLCNGMRPMHHREGGIVASCLLDETVYTELILDGVHVDESMTKLIYKNKTDKLVLVSDCMRAGGLEDGEYALGELKVLVKQTIARIESGSLAGSTLHLQDALKRLMNVADLDLESAVYHVTLGPAKAIGLDDAIGSLEVGKKADMTIVDDDLNVIATVVDGEIVYRK